ncbi:ubiquitin-conjugating enzyme E2 T-like [Glandiceps talaboti]
MQRATRMKREIQLLEREPPHGVSCWMKKDRIDELEAQILGGDETPYTGGIFKLEIQVPERYPFEPPKIRFVTPIYHPNIDNGGRICLDILKMPPGGSWKPSLNISTVLKSIQLLMADPNPDDPLMTDISNEYKFNRPQFMQNAKQWTHKHAIVDDAQPTCTIGGRKDKENNQQTINKSADSDSDSDSDETSSDDDDDDDDVVQRTAMKRKTMPGTSQQPVNKLSR